jgi:hypothetical protein
MRSILGAVPGAVNFRIMENGVSREVIQRGLARLL